jgi:hypothetical protein
MANSPLDLYAVEEFDVVGQPVTGLTLRLQRGARLAGRVVFDARTQQVPAVLTDIRLSLTPPTESRGMTVSGTSIGGTCSASTTLRADGTFEFAGVGPGSYKLASTIPAASGVWWLRSAIVGGRDVLDTTLDVSIGLNVANAVLTLTDKHSELSGTLQTATGQPAPDYFVIVMPADTALRVAGSRRVKSTRPATDGQFKFADLPAGDYLLVALTDVAPDEWQQPEFLTSIASAGVRVSLGDGEKKVQDLRIR